MKLSVTGMVGAPRASLLAPVKLRDVGKHHLCFVEKSLGE